MIHVVLADMVANYGPDAAGNDDDDVDCKVVSASDPVADMKI